MNQKVSIIVPVYNAEYYLEKCINCLKKQTYENLNDNREQRVVPELFEENGWNRYSWAKNIDFEPKRKYYVSSFCKSMNDSEMSKEYGACIYGYKDDRMAEVLAPIMFWNKRSEKIPVFTQIVAFDVIYN